MTRNTLTARSVRHSFGRAALAALGLAAVGVALTPAPVAAQNREHQQMSAELRILQEQQQQLAAALVQVADAVRALGTRVDDVGAVTRKGAADLDLRLAAVGADIGVVRERTQDTDTRVRSLRDEIDALRATIVALQGQLTQLNQAPSATLDPVDLSAAPATPPAGGSAPVPPPATAGLTPSRMLDSAKSDYFQGQWSLALSGFDAVIRTFPRSESASEAQFYIGETHFTQSRWMDAVSAYSLVIQNHPASSNVPEAYFKRGRAYEALGQTDAARTSWEHVVKTYPDTTGATLAKQGLERLSRRTAQ